MQRAALFIPAVFALALASTATGQDGDEPAGGEIIMGAWSNPENCNRANASYLSFSRLLADYKSIRGLCVAVEGHWFGRALFGRSRDARAEKSNVSRQLRHRRIGLYARGELLEAGPHEAERYLIVGLVGECETQWPGAIMVMGYCHYTGGPILLVSEVFQSGDPNGG